MCEEKEKESKLKRNRAHLHVEWMCTVYSHLHTYIMFSNQLGNSPIVTLLRIMYKTLRMYMQGKRHLIVLSTVIIAQSSLPWWQETLNIQICILQYITYNNGGVGD